MANSAARRCARARSDESRTRCHPSRSLAASRSMSSSSPAAASPSRDGSDGRADGLTATLQLLQPRTPAAQQLRTAALQLGCSDRIEDLVQPAASNVGRSPEGGREHARERLNPPTRCTAASRTTPTSFVSTSRTSTRKRSVSASAAATTPRRARRRRWKSSADSRARARLGGSVRPRPLQDPAARGSGEHAIKGLQRRALRMPAISHSLRTRPAPRAEQLPRRTTRARRPGPPNGQRVRHRQTAPRKLRARFLHRDIHLDACQRPQLARRARR